jgi:hypothetical protein
MQSSRGRSSRIQSKTEEAVVPWLVPIAGVVMAGPAAATDVGRTSLMAGYI